MRSRGILGIALTAVILTLPAHSTPGPEASAIRLAVVDFVAVRREAAAAQAIAQQVEAFVADYQSDIETEEAALRDAQEQLNQRREGLSQEDYALERHQWEQNVADAQRRFLNRRQAMDQARAQAWQQIEQTLNQTIRVIAEERNLLLILRQDQAVWVVPDLDITQEVLRRLDQALPAVTLTPPQG